MSESKAIAKYGSWGIEDAEKEREEAEKDGGNQDFFKPAQGNNALRIMPPRPGKPSPFVKVFEHFVNMPDGTKYRFACPRHHAKRFCPACAKADELRATGNPEDFKAAGDVIAKRRIYANAVDRAAPERGVVVFPFGKTIYDQLLALRASEEAGGDFTNPGPDGFDIVVNRKGEGLKTEYKVFPARKCTVLSSDPETAAAWLESMPNLDRYAIPPTDKELKERFGGDTGGSSAQTNNAAASPRRGPRRSAADDSVDTDD